MIRLKELHLENFRSYKKLDLVDLDKKGLTLINGKNGRGKTSFRTAIEYLLLDRTSDDLSLEELPRNSGKDCVMNCILQKDDNIIEITKYRNHSKYVNQTVLRVNGDDSLTTTDRRETQKNIELLLNITGNSLFTSTIFTSKSPSFPTAKETDRKDILYSALDLDKYKSYYKTAKDMCKEIESDVEALKSKKENKKEVLDELKAEKNNTKQQIEDYETNRKEKVANIINDRDSLEKKDSKEIWQEFENTNSDINNFVEPDINSYDSLLIKRRMTLEGFKKTLEAQENIEDEIDKLLNKVNELEKEKKDLKHFEEEKDSILDKISNIKIPDNNLVTEIAELTEIVIRLESEISNLEKEKENAGNGICPIFKDECDRLIKQKDEILENTEPKISKLNKKLEKANISLQKKQMDKSKIDVDIEELDRLNKELSGIDNSKELAINNNNNIDERIKEYKNQITELNDSKQNPGFIKNDIKIEEHEIENLETKKAELIGQKKEFDELKKKANRLEYEYNAIIEYNKSVDSKIEMYNKNIQDIVAEVNPYENMLTKLKNKEGGIKKDIKEIDSSINNLIDDLKYYEFWKTGFSKSGVPNLKSEGFLYALETEINNTLSTISDRMYVQLGNQDELKNKKVREKISYKVFHPDRKISNYSSHSSGERQRVKIADLFAFHDLIGVIDMMLFDEVLELSLDDQGIDEIMGILKIKASELGSLFVISHNERIKDKFDNVWTVHKENGVSYIKEN